MTRSRKRKLNRMGRRMAGVQMASTLLAGATAAYAQQVGSVSSEAPALEEIVVTAQKRSENLQSVPISVEALDSNGASAPNSEERAKPLPRPRRSRSLRR